MISRRESLVLLPLLLGLGACAPAGPYVWASDLPPTPPAPPKLRPGDRIQVVVYGQDTLSGEFEVRPGGEVVLPVAGSLTAEGLTPQALGQELANRLRAALADPKVTIVIASRQPGHVSVIGEVRTPGRYEVRKDEGVIDALARAGGLTPFADPDAVFVIRRSRDNQRVRFRYADLTAGKYGGTKFELDEGDVVVVE